MRLLRRLCWVVVFEATLGSAAAAAQPVGKPAATPSAAGTPADAARPRYEKGRAFEAAGKVDLAYIEYAAAYKLYSHWQIAGALGGVAFKLGKFLEAAERISQFLQQGQGLDPAERSEKQKQLAEAKSKIGTLAFETAAGSEIFVDGKSVGKTPPVTEVFVEPGGHQVEAKKAGERVNVNVDVGAGKREVVKMRYGGAGPMPTETAPVPTSTAAASGMSGTGPMTMHGDSAMMRKILLAAGGTVAVTGLVLGGVAVGVFVEEENKARTAMDMPTSTHSINAATYKNVAFWSFAGASAVGGATLLYYFLSQQNTAPVQVTGFAGPQGGGVSVRGQF